VTWTASAILMIGLSLLLMTLGLPVAFSFIATDMLGAYLFMGSSRGLEQFVSNMAPSISSFLLVPIPLFVLMGDLMIHTGLARRVIDGFDALIGPVPGRLCHVTIGAGTAFGSLSGSALAGTAMLGATLVPEMMRRGYSKQMAMGPILGAGGLSILIPPSALTVLLGSIAQMDIGRLLVAGIVPALVLVAMYVVMIIVQVKLDPAGAPHYESNPQPWAAKLFAALVNIAPMGLVVFCVSGLIVMGVATPTESAAFGVLSMLLLAAAFRCLTWRAVRAALEGTLRVSVMLDANGSNTTAVAAVAKLQQAAGDVKGRRAVITAGTGPVGVRAAGLLAKGGADVTITSRKAAAPALVDEIRQRFSGTVKAIAMPDSSHAAAALEGAELILNAGVAGVCLVPRAAWAGRTGLRAAADLNAVPPAGIEGIDVGDDGAQRDGVAVFGALGVGGLKMKLHRACIALLFERNDLVLDAETIAEVARELVSPQS